MSIDENTVLCVRCKINKPASDFSKASRKSNGLKSWCKECSNSYKKEWHRNNKKHVDQYRFDYRSDPNNREKERIYSKRYWAKHYDKKLAHNSLREKRLREAPGGPFFTNRKDYEERRKFYNYKCAYCGQPAVTLDHAIPVSRGGTNHASNIYPCCSSCNMKKMNKILRSEFPVILCFP